MAKANKYQVHRKGGKLADNVFFAELAMVGGWRHLARYWNHYCAFANLVHQYGCLKIMKMIIFLIQVGFGEMHWHAISVPKVASYASANVELCTVHLLYSECTMHLLHSAHIAQCIFRRVHILHYLVAKIPH